MQRVITDFGADHAFGLVPKKLQEHYGVVISASTVRAITEHHAGQLYQAEERITDQPKADGCKILIGEIDGSMIPVVKVDEEAEDSCLRAWLSADLVTTWAGGLLGFATLKKLSNSC